MDTHTRDDEGTERAHATGGPARPVRPGAFTAIARGTGPADALRANLELARGLEHAHSLDARDYRLVEVDPPAAGEDRLGHALAVSDGLGPGQVAYYVREAGGMGQPDTYYFSGVGAGGAGHSERGGR